MGVGLLDGVIVGVTVEVGVGLAYKFVVPVETLP